VSAIFGIPYGDALIMTTKNRISLLVNCADDDRLKNGGNKTVFIEYRGQKACFRVHDVM